MFHFVAKFYIIYESMISYFLLMRLQGNLSTLPEPLYSRPSRMEGIPIPILRPLVDFGVTLSAHSVLSRLSSAFGAEPPDIYSLTNSRSATDAERRLAVRNKRRYTAYIYHLSHQSAVYSKNDTHYRAYSRGCDNVQHGDAAAWSTSRSVGGRPPCRWGIPISNSRVQIVWAGLRV